MRFIIMSFLLLLMSDTSFASCNGVACEQVKIQRLFVRAGMVYINTTGIESNLDNCVPLGGNELKLLNSHDNSDKIYAMLLTAFTANLNVMIRLDGNIGDTGECIVNYAYLGG